MSNPSYPLVVNAPTGERLILLQTGHWLLWRDGIYRELDLARLDDALDLIAVMTAILTIMPTR